MISSKKETFTRYTLPFTRVLRVPSRSGRKIKDRISVFVPLITHHAQGENRQTAIEEWSSEDGHDVPTREERSSEREKSPIRREVAPCLP